MSRKAIDYGVVVVATALALSVFNDRPKQVESTPKQVESLAESAEALEIGRNTDNRTAVDSDNTFETVGEAVESRESTRRTNAVNDLISSYILFLKQCIELLQ